MKQTKKPCYAMRAACVLLCLVLISVHLVTGLYARFINKAVGSDSSRAAAYRVSAVMTGESGTYEIALSNRSEAAARYSVTFETTPGMYTSVKLNDLTADINAEGKAEFPNVGALAPKGNGSLTLVLTPNPVYTGSGSDDTVLDFSNESTSSAENELPFTVTVRYVQVN